MNAAEKTELLNLVTDHALEGWAESDKIAEGYAQLVLEFYGHCLDGTIKRVRKNMPTATDEYLGVLAELGYDPRDRAEISQTIFQQMGAAHFASMVGIKKSGDVTFNDLTTTFKIKGSRKVNRISVTLDQSDTYTVRFHKQTGGRWSSKRGEFSPVKDKTVSTFSDVYADQLISLGEQETGLYFKL